MKSLLFGCILCCSIEAVADFATVFTLWHQDKKGPETITVVAILGDHYRRNFGEPDGLLPLLIKGEHEGNSFTAPFRDFNQAWYLNQIEQRSDIYGEAGKQIAGGVGIPSLALPGQVSGIYFYRHGSNGMADFSEPILSLRFVAPDSEGLIPEDRDYEDLLRGIKTPEVREGESVANVSYLGSDPATPGVIDLSRPVRTRLVSVYRAGQLEVKSMGRDTKDPTVFQKYFPDLFRIAYYLKMFDYGVASFPSTFTRFENGTPVPPNPGAQVSVIRASCYSEKLLHLFLSMGFKEWHSASKAGEPTHYFLWATPEMLAEGTEKFSDRLSSTRPTARVLTLNVGLIERMRNIQKRLRKNGSRLDCGRLSELLNLGIPLELLPSH